MATEISRLFVAIGAKTDEFHKGIDGVQSKMDKVSKKMKIAGGIMVGAVAAIGVASLKMAGDFDGAMREVNTMMLLSEDEFKDFSKEIQNFSKEMGVNAVDSANALYQAISAGVPKENAVDFLTVATKAAIGGVTDTKTAVDGLTTVMNAFGIPVSEAEKIADTMFTTVKGGKTTFEELSSSLFNVAPIAAASGVSFEEVSAALATMTAQGVPTAQATTQLRQAMVALQKPTADMQTVITDLGYESGQAMLSELGFADTINTLRDATGGSNEQLMRMFGSVEAGQAILALTGEKAGDFGESLNAMENSAGAAQAAFEIMEESTGRQLEKLKVGFQDIAITLGTALMPLLQRLVDFIGPIITKIGDWISAHPKLSVAILGIILVVGGLLLVLGPLLSLLPMIGAAFTAMLGPIGLIILAIAGAIAIGVAIWKNWDTIKEKAKQIFGAIADFFKGIWDKITGFFSTAWDTIVNIVKTAVNFVLGIINGLITGFEGAINFVIKGINSFIGLMNKPIQLLNKIPGVNLPLIPTIGEIKLPRIPLLDVGGLIEGPGLFAVGRGVKEIVREPGAGGNVVNINIEGPWFIREEADIPKIARELYRLQERKMAAMGV